jgi:uncharacterized membrane protein
MNRLSYIDWMRGLACVLMFQTHCYDSWLSPEARGSEWFYWSQRLGTFPAPLFLFLAGISFALVTGKLRGKGTAPEEIARQTMLRGAEIFGLALLFRLQEFLLGQPHAPWTDLLRVDILNLMGLSMVVMGALCRLAPSRAGTIASSIAGMLVIILVTPPLWTTWRGVTAKLPWPLESYVNGVHTFPEPQPWLFPIFPWAGFAFAGLAAGFVIFSEEGRKREGRTLLLLGLGGGALALGAWWLDRLPVQIYPVYDFWHTSPNFFLIRLGMLLMILWGCYAWCRWGWGARGFSPMIQLGTTSLLVYWVHIQFVYGGLSILNKRTQTVPGASLGLLIICAAMLLLSLAKTHWELRKAKA